MARYGMLLLRAWDLAGRQYELLRLRGLGEGLRVSLTDLAPARLGAAGHADSLDCGVVLCLEVIAAAKGLRYVYPDGAEVALRGWN